MVNSLFETEQINSSRYFVAFISAQRTINKLEKFEIIIQVGNLKCNRIYYANALLTILEAPAKL